MDNWSSGTPEASPSGVAPVTTHRAVVLPHRGAVILALGILSLLLCFICGIFGWIMANNDLRQMSRGTMDPTGVQLTQAGKILSIVGVVLQCAALLLWFCMFGFMVLVAGAGARALP